MNPQHTIPTIQDGDFTLWESRAVMQYLANKYAKDDTLYPKDPAARAVVDQRLYFDFGTLYTPLIEYYRPIVFQKKEADPEVAKKVEAGLEMFNTLLEGKKYAAGDNITIADLAIVATVSTMEIFNFPIDKFPNVARWLKDCKENIVGYEVNQEGIDAFRQLMAARA